MFEKIKLFFDSASFMPHGHCYLWQADILWLNVISDAVIAISYFIIPAFLVYLVKKRKDFRFNWIFVMFALFIVACGGTHIMDIWTVWNPVFAWQGVVKLFTAIISLATAFSMIPLVKKALLLPSINDLEDKQKELTKQAEIFAKDIAERKNIESNLKKQETRIRKIIESIPNGILMVDKDGKIVLTNPVLEMQFGYLPDELIGQKIEMLVPRKFKHEHVQHRDSYFSKPVIKQMGAGRDLFGLRKDGSEFAVEIGLNPLLMEEEQFTLASVVDITKRKLLENQIRQSAIALKQKNEEMEQFVYTVSHDLKSPLVTSTGFLGLLKEDLAANRFDQVQDSITRLERANARMNQLITDLLQLSRAGRMRADIESVDVAGIVKMICENLTEQIKEKSVHVVMHEPIPLISADKKKIYQVFENLLVNALKYGCVGQNPKIEVGGFEHEQEIHIYVKDNGPGIAKQYHKKIFKLFERLENDNRGTGVGLAIVSRIMQIHNGRIWLESDPESKTNPGSCFWLSFPKVYQKTTEGEDSDTGI